MGLQICFVPFHKLTCLRKLQHFRRAKISLASIYGNIPMVLFWFPNIGRYPRNIFSWGQCSLWLQPFSHWWFIVPYNIIQALLSQCSNNENRLYCCNNGRMMLSYSLVKKCLLASCSHVVNLWITPFTIRSLYIKSNSLLETQLKIIWQPSTISYAFWLTNHSKLIAINCRSNCNMFILCSGW